jgi:two-component system, OmpR family, phosphate regulon response regulator PhoB
MGAGDETYLILVADDEADMRDLLRLRMEDEGYRVESARDGEEALRIARELRPDLCVFDVVMPGLRGHEVLRALRDLPETRAIPVVLVTATLENRAMLRLAPRPDDFMRKSKLGELESRVRALLEEPLAQGA